MNIIIATILAAPAIVVIGMVASPLYGLLVNLIKKMLGEE